MADENGSTILDMVIKMKVQSKVYWWKWEYTQGIAVKQEWKIAFILHA